MFLPVVLVTTLDAVEDRVQGAEAGADDFLTKPVDMTELLARTRSLLQVKRLHDALEARTALLRRVLGRYLADDIVEQAMADPDYHTVLILAVGRAQGFCRLPPCQRVGQPLQTRVAGAGDAGRRRRG